MEQPGQHQRRESQESLGWRVGCAVASADERVRVVGRRLQRIAVGAGRARGPTVPLRALLAALTLRASRTSRALFARGTVGTFLARGSGCARAARLPSDASRSGLPGRTRRTVIARRAGRPRWARGSWRPGRSHAPAATGLPRYRRGAQLLHLAGQSIPGSIRVPQVPVEALHPQDQQRERSQADDDDRGERDVLAAVHLVLAVVPCCHAPAPRVLRYSVSTSMMIGAMMAVKMRRRSAARLSASLCSAACRSRAS